MEDLFAGLAPFAVQVHFLGSIGPAKPPRTIAGLGKNATQFRKELIH
jgi:hypothetical protein